MRYHIMKFLLVNGRYAMRLNLTLRLCVSSCVWPRIRESKPHTKYVMHFAIVCSASSGVVRMRMRTPAPAHNLICRPHSVPTSLVVQNKLQQLRPTHSRSQNAYSGVTYFVRGFDRSFLRQTKLETHERNVETKCIAWRPLTSKKIMPFYRASGL